jgi:hypothetical protein
MSNIIVKQHGTVNRTYSRLWLSVILGLLTNREEYVG